MAKKNSDSKMFAFLAVFLSVLGFIIAILVKRKDKYVMFYAKQSLVLFLAGIFVKVLTFLLMITIVGQIAIPVAWVIYIVLWIIAVVNSISGKQKETPWIGHYARSIDL